MLKMYQGYFVWDGLVSLEEGLFHPSEILILNGQKFYHRLSSSPEVNRFPG